MLPPLHAMSLMKHHFTLHVRIDLALIVKFASKRFVFFDVIFKEIIV